VLQHHGLAGLGRGHQQAALAFADGRDDVDDAPGEIFVGADVALQVDLLGREQRRQVLEQDLVFGIFGRFTVDLVHLDQRHIAFAFLGGADLTFDGVAGVQVEATHLAGADVDVIRTGEIGGVGRAQEAEAVRQHFQCAVAVDALTFLRLVLQQGEDQVLFAHAVGVVDLVGNGHFHQFGDVLGLDVG